MKNIIIIMFLIMFITISCSQRDKMEKACSEGDKTACTWIKQDNLCGNGKNGNTKACEWLKTKENCDKGNQNECMIFGNYWYSGDDNTPEDRKTAETYFRKGCSGENKEKCYTLAKTLISKENNIQGASLFCKIACDNGVDEACFYNSTLTNCSEGDIIACTWINQDKLCNNGENGNTQACEWLETKKNCDNGNQNECILLGNYWYSGDNNTPEDRKIAETYFRKGCSGDNKEKCYTLANTLVSKEGHLRNAFLFYKIACENEIGDACFYQATLLGQNNLNETQKQQIRNSCEMGSVKCCYYSYLLAKDKNEKQKYLEKGCELGGLRSCADLAMQYQKEGNIDKARETLKKQETYKTGKINWIVYDSSSEFPPKVCKETTLAKYSNWRAATISELRTLIQNCPSTETNGNCEVSNECLKYGCSNNCKGCSSYSYTYTDESFYSKSDLMLSGTVYSYSTYKGKAEKESGEDGHFSFWRINFNNAEIDSEWHGSAWERFDVLCIRKESEQNEVTEKISDTAQEKTESISPSFDCNKASTFIEKTICDSNELSNLDKKMVEQYKEALKNDSVKDEIKKSQLEWRNHIRNKCETAECIKDAYTKRIEELNKNNGN